MSKINDDKGFNAAIKAISKSGEAFASYIHNAGLYALQQVNEHGNTGFGTRLMDAIGRKHDAKRVEKWLCHFGKFDVKSGVLVYRARRDILPENLTAILTEAEATPYWELNEQEHHAFKFNALSMLQGILNRYKTAQEKEANGEQVSIEGQEFIAAIEQTLKAAQQAAAEKVKAAVQGEKAPAVA